MTPEEEAEHYTYLKLKEKQAMGSQGHPSATIANIAKLVPSMASLAYEDTVKHSAAPAAITIAGLAGGAPVAGLTAGTLAIGKRMAGIASGQQPPSGTPWQEAKGPMIDAATASVLQEPKVLNGIPGVPAVKEMASNMISSAGRGLAKAGQTLSGVKADILNQAARQGLSTYTAPSLPKAQSIFAGALGPKGERAMRQTAKEAFEPALEKARAFATKIGTKIENGEPVTALEALKARQATDRVISGTPITDKLSREALYGWRNQFDNELAGQSGKLADASRTYRKAIVKDTILNPTRLNKSGEPSAFLPMIVGHGMIGKGIEGGLGMLTATSPAMWGLGATAGGSAVRGLNVLGQDPTIRQTLFQILQKMRSNKIQ